MTTKQENELLTQTGAGTPMGEVLRRYWWPVGLSASLQNKPTFIRLLGEDIVLFRDREGRVGALGALCSHRRANLCFGTVTGAGLMCRYHGWTYDVTGTLLLTPGEPPNSSLKDEIRHPAYPTQELGGLIFVYLGPEPVPLLPRFDFLAADGERDARVLGVVNCNWLQTVENGMDAFHVSFTHSDIWTYLAPEPEAVRHEKTEWGIVYKALRPARPEERDKGAYNYRVHQLLMPGISYAGTSRFGRARWGVPIDATQCLQVEVRWSVDTLPPRGPEIARGWDPVMAEPYKEYKSNQTPVLGYDFPNWISGEDATLTVSMGAIPDRENEHLTSEGDEGIKMLRQVYFEGIEAVRAGGDPLGVIRDEAKNHLIILAEEREWISEAERAEFLSAWGVKG